MSYVVILIVLAIIGWFWFAKRRGDNFSHDVAGAVARRLRERCEPEHAVKNYLNSMEFATLWKGGYHTGGDQFVVAAEAIDSYTARAEFWRNTPNT